MRPSNLRSFILYSVVIFGFFSLNACSLILTRPHEATIEHTVRYKGETTSLISAWYTGSSKNAKQIRRFNGLGQARLKLGQEIFIPRRLLVRTSPLPRSFITANYAKKETTIALPESSLVQNESKKKKENPLDLVYASPSSVVKGDSSPKAKSNDWVQEELERDLIQERLVKSSR